MNKKQTQWSYKNKDVDELYSYINQNLNLASTDILQSASKVMKSGDKFNENNSEIRVYLDKQRGLEELYPFFVSISED